MALLRELIHDESGLVSVEHALLLGLVATAAIVVWSQLGREELLTVRRASRTLRRSLRAR